MTGRQNLLRGPTRAATILPMGRRVALEELLLGMEGAALLRNLLDGEQDFIDRRVAAMRKLVDAVEGDVPRIEVPELDVDAGYEAWAPIYDEMPNALIEAEEPLVDEALDGLEPGRALDAACGTGRHTARLMKLGHETVGVDRSEAMLAVARERAPGAELRTGDLTDLPVEGASMDVAVCALALTHLPDPSGAIAELARVVRPGGTIVLSDAHPAFVLLLGQALFPSGDGFAFVRNHVHLHGTYLAAFADRGLEAVSCREATIEDDFTQGLLSGAAEAAAAVFDGLPAALVWTLRA